MVQGIPWVDRGNRGDEITTCCSLFVTEIRCFARYKGLGTLHFGFPVGGELAGGQGLRIPYRGNKRGSHSLVSTEFSN